MKQIIRLTENDLHRLVGESVKRILKEHDVDYVKYDDDFNEEEYVQSCADECSVWFIFLPETKELIPEPDEEPDGVNYSVLLTPKFCDRDEYGFYMNGVDFEFDAGDKHLNDELYNKYGELISQLINDNFNSIYEYIKKDSYYTIY